MRRSALPLVLTGFISAATLVAPPAHSNGLPGVVDAIRSAGGHYVRGGASPTAADCSGLVSVAQTMATGQPVRRLGDTQSLLAGRWPNVIPGASESDRFIIGVNSAHMVARIDGVGIEATTSGAPFKIGADAQSPFAPQFRQYRVDPAVLI